MISKGGLQGSTEYTVIEVEVGDFASHQYQGYRCKTNKFSDYNRKQ